MVGRHELADLAPRDVVARGILAVMGERGLDHVWLDARHLGVAFLEKRFPSIVARCRELGFDPATELLTVNDEFTACIVLSRCQAHDNGRNYWKVRFDTSLLPDITVAVRLDQTNASALDYYLLPRLDFGQPRIHLADQNPIEFESYRFDTLDYLYAMAARARLRRVA